MLDFFIQVQQSAGGGGGGAGSAYVYNGDGDVATTPTHFFVTSLSSSDSYVAIYDLSDPTTMPTTPTAEYRSGDGEINSLYDAAANCVAIKDGYAYVGTGNSRNKLYVFDVSNPNVLGASQLVSVTTDSTHYADAIDIHAHPSEDILYVSLFGGRITTVDISNPASPSVIDTVVETDTYVYSTMSKDGNYIYLSQTQTSPSTSLIGYELDTATGNLINRTVFDFRGDGAGNSIYGHGPSFAVSPNNGYSYIIDGKMFGNGIGVYDLSSSLSISAYNDNTDALIWDKVTKVANAPYVSNYDATADLAMWYYSLDDSALGVCTYSSGTITNQVRVIDTGRIGANFGYFDFWENYAIVTNGAGNDITTYEWDSLTTITQIGYGVNVNSPWVSTVSVFAVP